MLAEMAHLATLDIAEHHSAHILHVTVEERQRENRKHEAYLCRGFMMRKRHCQHAHAVDRIVVPTICRFWR